MPLAVARIVDTVLKPSFDQLVHYRLVDGRLIRAGATVVAAGTGPRHAVVPPSGRWYVAAELGSAVLALHRDTATGRLAQTAGPTAATAYDVDGNLPSAIVLAGDGRHLYVANRGANTVATFAIGDDGVPRMRGEVDCGGDWPRDIVIADNVLFVANQRSHTVVGFRLDSDSALPQRTGDVAEIGSPTCLVPR